MELNGKTKDYIDSLDYQSLLEVWRFAPLGDPLFEGESGDYITERLKNMRNENPQRHVETSKRIGWG